MSYQHLPWCQPEIDLLYEFKHYSLGCISRELNMRGFVRSEFDVANKLCWLDDQEMLADEKGLRARVLLERCQGEFRGFHGLSLSDHYELIYRFRERFA